MKFTENVALGDRSFPVEIVELPASFLLECVISSLITFRHELKTHLFRSSYYTGLDLFSSVTVFLAS